MKGKQIPSLSRVKGPISLPRTSEFERGPPKNYKRNKKKHPRKKGQTVCVSAPAFPERLHKRHFVITRAVDCRR